MSAARTRPTTSRPGTRNLAKRVPLLAFRQAVGPVFPQPRRGLRRIETFLAAGSEPLYDLMLRYRAWRAKLILKAKARRITVRSGASTPRQFVPFMLG